MKRKEAKYTFFHSQVLLPFLFFQELFREDGYLTSLIGYSLQLNYEESTVKTLYSKFGPHHQKNKNQVFGRLCNTVLIFSSSPARQSRISARSKYTPALL